jgi:hypothetical protein
MSHNGFCLKVPRLLTIGLFFDTMRGWTASGNAPALSPNLSNDESPKSDWLSINSTGFTMPTGIFASSDNIIYIAIRRGPMKTPEAGTEVFSSDFKDWHRWCGINYWCWLNSRHDS